MKDENAQLLLVAIVILAVTLILIASSAAVLLSVKKDILREVTDSFATDFEDIKLKLGYALVDKLNLYYNNATNKTKNETILNAFNETTTQFEYLLALRNLNFEASMNATDIDAQTYDANNNTIAFNITLRLSSTNAYIKEKKHYLFKKTAGRFELRL